MSTRPVIVLVEPQFAFNVGMTARAMGNFGFTRLVLVRPACAWDGKEAVQFSMKGRKILENCRLLASLEELKAEGLFCIGTTRQGGRYRSRRFLPWELKDVLTGKPDTALVFGNESRGLTTPELRAMDGLATLPAVKGEEGSVNLAMAVALFLYALSHEEPAASNSGREELDRLGDALVRRLQTAGVFSSGDYRHGPARLLRIIQESHVPASEIPFLHALLTALDKKR